MECWSIANRFTLPWFSVGRFGKKITINTDHEKVKELSFYVHGEIVDGNIYVDTNHLFFSKRRKNRTIWLRALSDATFKVLDAKSTTPDLVTKVKTIREGMEYWVTVRTTEDFDYVNDLLKGSIIIRTDDKEQDIIRVRVTGGYGRRAWKKQ